MKKNLAGIGLVAGYFLVGHYFNFYLKCPIYELTHLYCPGCGITRMIISLVKGNFYQAFRYNPLLFILIPFVVWYFLDVIIASKRKKNPFLERFEPNIWYILIGIFMVYGILRNIPGFEFLQPYEVMTMIV